MTFSGLYQRGMISAKTDVESDVTKIRVEKKNGFTCDSGLGFIIKNVTDTLLI